MARLRLIKEDGKVNGSVILLISTMIVVAYIITGLSLTIAFKKLVNFKEIIDTWWDARHIVTWFYGIIFAAHSVTQGAQAIGGGVKPTPLGTAMNNGSTVDKGDASLIKSAVSKSVSGPVVPPPDAI